MRRFIERAAAAMLSAAGYSIVPYDLGYLIIANWRLRQRDLPELIRDAAFVDHLSRLFQSLGVDCVIDVGANTGQYARFLRERVGYRGLILSFEPAKDPYEQLVRAAEGDGAWRPFRLALGRENSTRSLNVMKVTQFNSFLQPTMAQPGQLGELNVVDHVETSDIRRLDEVWPDLKEEFGFRCPYLKLDTQGFDLEVIEGAGAVLSEIPALQSEMSVLPIYRGMPSYREALSCLERRGYAISGLFWINTVQWRMLEFDCVMIRSVAAGADDAAALTHRDGVK